MKLNSRETRVISFLSVWAKTKKSQTLSRALKSHALSVRLTQTNAILRSHAKTIISRAFKHGKLYIIGKLNKCRFRKKIWIASFLNSTKQNCKNDRENDHESFRQTNELIGYQNLAHFCEIWPEHSLDVVKQKCVRDIWNL